MDFISLRDGVFTVSLVILALLLLLCLFKAVKGPRIADRMVCVNMIGSIVIAVIAILAIMLSEGYLTDICIIYAMISFLAVVVFCKTYMGVYLENAANKKEGQNE